MKTLPNKIKILHVIYRIVYVDNPSKVDLTERRALWGQVDYWTRTIRVYKKGRPHEDIMHTIIHECVHAIISQQDILNFKPSDEHFVDLFASGILSLINENKLK